MNLFPIVERELRVASRRRWTYRARVIAATASLLIGGSCALFLYLIPSGFPMEPGEWIFRALSGICLFYCLIEGGRVTADCLSFERRAGTLGFLFLTNLKAWQIVLGKLAARSFNAFGCVLAVMPMLSLTLLMGGVTSGEFWRICLVLTGGMFLSMGCGMWISARSRIEHRALAGTALLVLAIVWLPSLTDTPSPTATAPPNASGLYLITPFTAFHQASEATYITRPHAYWISTGLSLMIGAFFLFSAARVVSRNWRDSMDNPPVSKKKLKLVAPESREEQIAFRRATLDTNPIYWLAARGRMQWQWFAATIALCLVLLFYYVGKENDPMFVFMLYQQFQSGMALLMKLGLGWLACRTFLEARQNGALELWLCAPLSSKRIVDGQRLALRKLWITAICLIVFLSTAALVMAGIWPDPSGMTGMNWFWEFTFPTIVCNTIVSVTTLAAMAWTGMWFGLNSTSLTLALTKTFGSVVIVPWFALSIAWGLFFVSMQWLGALQLISVIPSFFQIGQALLFVAKDVAFILWARKQLNTKFRIAASEGIRKPQRRRKRTSEPPPLPPAK